MLDATGPSRPRNAGRYRPFASAECWTLPALRVRGMLDATGPSRSAAHWPRPGRMSLRTKRGEPYTVPAVPVVRELRPGIHRDTCSLGANGAPTSVRPRVGRHQEVVPLELVRDCRRVHLNVSRGLAGDTGTDRDRT